MTAGVCGHSNPIIQEAIISTVSQTGLNLGATTVTEAQFAKKVRDRFPSMESLRFCNSGTEANLYALSIVRRVTGLSKIIVFSGAYHGGVLTFVHGVAKNNVNQDDWIIGKYNDVESVRELIARNKGKAAAVLVEGMQGAGGCIPGTSAFLHAIQIASRENGMLFILDEVMTSRLAPGGIQSRLLSPYDGTPLKPDLTTLGKYLAGGMTIGAFGGRKDFLAVYDPRPAPESQTSAHHVPPISHSGTFNNNTLAMNVGLAAITSVYTPDVCTQLNTLGDWLRQSLFDIFRGTRMAITGVGAVCNIHLTAHPDQEILCVEDLETETSETDTVLRDIFWFYAIQRGFWLARRGMLALIVGTTKAELQGFLDMADSFVRKFQDFLV
ncbi:hypothetical protein N7462_007713 [Penicillium macrosclerotiorum]|uniref:uncharacterized protein n=1 Tax=Penicillium macrosclerotiorum TaxID=303699 RepID=UPI0025482A8A|nr:uncharacterized protein N7462_007713 [Penicillium macrosclerotiorum]KAJ5679469.1 hypothetical protein N7462_007713 [Penicillium macrosclerotiorum]